MAELKLLDFTVSLTSQEETLKDIKMLLSSILEDFDEDKASIKLMSGGFVNKILKVDHEDSHLVVRLFTDKTEVLARPELSVLSMRAVQLAGLGPDVLAWFTNGVVYGYQEGEMVMPVSKELNTPDIRRKIIKKLAALNQIDAKTIKIKGISFLQNYQNEEYVLRSFSHLPDDYNGETLFKSHLNVFGTKDSLKQEHDWIKKEVLSLDLDNAFSHGDLWWANILYDSQEDEINFIDYDLTGYNPFPLDLAHVLLRSQVSMFSFALPQLSEEEDKSLCRLYMEETRRLQGNSKPVTEEDVVILYGLTKLFKTYVFCCCVIFVITNILVANMQLHHLIAPCEEVYRKIKEDYQKFRRENENLFIKKWKI